ncbi:sulfurtransferase TusA family protein [Desulfobacula sp.]
MALTIDARGLSCPQPVLMFMDAVKSASDKEFIILVDTDASKENVSRAAESQNCKVADINLENDKYRIMIIRN